MEQPRWIKKQTVAKDHEIIEARATDPIKDFTLDSSGFYVLIRIVAKKKKIAVAICNAQHEMIKTFEGETGRDLWTAIFKYETQHKLAWFSRKDHIAYLGKELKKAELSLADGSEYIQE